MSIFWKKYGGKNTEAVKTSIGICSIYVFPISGGEWAWQLSVGGRQLKADSARTKDIAKTRALGLLARWAAGIFQEASEAYEKEALL